jgi:hypothetical protein
MKSFYNISTLRKTDSDIAPQIDFMILPYLAVCYAFFYIDKTTLSYAGS